MIATERVINDLNVAKLMLCNPQMLTPEMCVKIGQAISSVIALLKEREPITGETSDGYHTFNELYHHRAVLFSVIVANYPDRAWKSKKHHDGTMYDNMFIVGIDTPDGQATYHYDVDPYWDMFKCRVLDSAPEWDGHTPAQAIERIGRLKEQEAVVLCKDCKYCSSEIRDGIKFAKCELKHNWMPQPEWFCADGERQCNWFCADWERKKGQ